MPSPQKPPETSQDWRSLQPHVFRMVRKDLGPFLRSKLESSDVVQDVLSAVACTGEQWDADRGTNFMAWVEGVVRNRIRNLDKYHKRKKRDGRVEQPLAGESSVDGGEDPVVDMSPAEIVEEGQDSARLIRCMEGLSEDQRRLILLREYEGCSWSQIAEATGRETPDSARMAHGRAVGKLTIAFKNSKQHERDGMDGHDRQE